MAEDTNLAAEGLALYDAVFDLYDESARQAWDNWVEDHLRPILAAAVGSIARIGATGSRHGGWWYDEQDNIWIAECRVQHQDRYFTVQTYGETLDITLTALAGLAEKFHERGPS